MEVAISKSWVFLAMLLQVTVTLVGTFAFALPSEFLSSRKAVEIESPLLAPTVAVNPALPGNFTSRRSTYNLTVLKLDGFPVPVEVLAEVTYPLGATGIRPIILLLHGIRESCYYAVWSSALSAWPCAKPYLPLPSYQGYRYITDVLASKGYIAVSVSANGINGQHNLSLGDNAIYSQSILLRHHLALWAKWNSTGGDPWGGIFQGKVNLNKVVLFGQDFGGQAIHRAAIDASTADPFKIAGLVSLGPIAHRRQVTPDVHSATILPICDGVSNLEGQAYIDASRDIAYSQALRSAVIVAGANSNYFNTVWTSSWLFPRDDWPYSVNDVCSYSSSSRLSPQEQQVVGLSYTLALVRLATKRDVTMLQFLDGSFVRPEGIGRAEVTTSAVGGARNRLLYRPEDIGIPRLANGMKGGECVGNDYSNSSLPVCRNGQFGFDSPWYRGSPHFRGYPYATSRPGPVALELEWTNKLGAVALFPIRNVISNFSGLDWVDVRIANDPEALAASFELLVTDRSGKNASLYSNLTTIHGWPELYPNNYRTNRILARTLRGSLASVRDHVDVNAIVAVHLVALSDSGKVWVFDVAASQAQIRRPKNLDLPVLSIETKTVDEGNGLQAYSLDFTTNQMLSVPGSIWVTIRDEQQYRLSGFQLELSAGSESVVASVPVFSWIADNIFTPRTREFEVVIEAVKGVVIGNYSGILTIKEDDPIPRAFVTTKNVTAVEGRALRWLVELSSPADSTALFFKAIPPSEGVELMTSDIDSRWFKSIGQRSPPFPPVPLSQYDVHIPVYFEGNVTRVNLTIPLVSDGLSEGDEVVVLQSRKIVDWYYRPVFNNITLFGTVPAHS